MSIRITCVNKSDGDHENPHEAIIRFGWTNEQTGEIHIIYREDLWKWVNDGGVAYVKDAHGNTVSVRAQTNSHGIKYLQAEADGKPTDNLLALPECS
jgi:hypothetical protein